MRTIEMQAYKFNELDDNAKLQAIKYNIYINVNYDWYDCTYETLRECGIKVNSFDTGRNNSCEISFLITAHEVATNIVDTFGEAMDIVLYAKKFIKGKYSFVYFKRRLESEILNWLIQEYEYLTSEEAIIETIEANEYEFTKEGKSI